MGIEIIVSLLTGGGLSALGNWLLARRKSNSEIDKDLEGRLREMLKTEREHCERELLRLNLEIEFQAKEISDLKKVLGSR